MASKGLTYFKKAISLLLCIVLCFSIIGGIPKVEAAGQHATKGTTLGANDQVQAYIDGAFDADWYEIVPTEEMYYRFSIRNQSAEVRTGIASVDSLVNLFLSQLNVEIFDQYDERLAQTAIRCGYTNSISVKLVPGNKYYVKVTSTIAGNYRINTKTIQDIGPDTWQEAAEVELNANIVSAIDAASDEDWYTFTADEERSYYNFSLENIGKSGYQEFWLYEYVAGAGETPWRDITDFSVYRGSTKSVSLQLKEGVKYCYCICGDTGGYVLNVEQTLDAAGPSRETAYSLNLNTKYTTTFDGADDVDYFVFKTDADNAYYHINFESLNASGYSFINLYDASGNPVKNGEVYKIGKRNLNALLNPDSYYFVALKGNKSNYTISVDKKADTYFNEIKDAKGVAFEKTYKSSFDGEGDKDFISFKTTSENAYYHFNYESLSNNGYSYMTLYDSDYNEVKSAEKYKTGTATFNERLEPNSIYYVRFYSGGEGNYTFSINKKADAYYNEKDKATKISLNKAYTTYFEGNDDLDWFKFTTPSYDAAYSLQFEVVSSSGYSYMHLYEEDGTQIDYREQYRVGTPVINIALEPNTTYYVRTKGSNGKYKLTVNYERDYEGNNRDKAKSLTVNKTYEAKLQTTADVDWFKFTVKSDNYYRIYSESESGSLDFNLYNSREGNEYSVIIWSELDKSIFLKSGTYYIKISRYNNNPKYYSIIVADCGNGHKEKSVYTKKATTSEAGTKKVECSKCGKFLRTESVPKIASVKLSTASYTYNGSVKTPSVEVKDSAGKTLKKNTDYTVTYASGRKNVGTYKVTIKFMGKYSGTKNLYFKIKAISVTKCKIKLSATSYTYNGKGKTPSVVVKSASGTTLKKGTHYTVTYASGRKNVGKYKVTIKMKGNYSGTKTLYFSINPPKTSVLKLTPGKKQLKVYVSKKTAQVSGYQIQYSTSKSFKSYKTVTLAGYKKTSTTIKKLSAKKTYYVRVRTYKTVSGKKYYSAWSTVKYKKTK